MDILFVVPYAPNLVRTRPYNLIRALSRRGNRVTVLTLWTNEQERADLHRLQRDVHQVAALPMPMWRSLWNCVRALPSSTPLQSVFSWRSDLFDSLDGRFPREFDVAHVEHLRGSRYGLHLKKSDGLPVVWDSVDCITHLFSQSAAKSKNLLGRWRSQFDLARTEKYEGFLRDQFDHVLVTSPVDQQELSALGMNGQTWRPPVSVLRNGVDLAYFTPDETAVREPATLVISGKMSYHANISMTLRLVEEIMPRVWQKWQDVKLWIVGKDPSHEIQSLAAHPAVTVTGTVADLRPYLRQATIAVSPIAYGAGIQNKVLEAMACATPVITTPQAVSALEIVPDRDVVVAEENGRFADAILSLLADPERQGQIGQAGLAHVRQHHDWDGIAAQLETIYQQAMADMPATRLAGQKVV